MQAQLRFESPSRDRMTSVVGFAVDAEKLRTQHVPALLRDRLADRATADRLPAARCRRARRGRARVFASDGACARTSRSTNGTFPIIFFDKELLEFAAPYEQHREIWHAADRLRPADDSGNRQRQHAAADGADDRAGRGDGARRLSRRRRRGARGARRRTEIQLCRVGLARPQDAAGADSAVRRDARARARAEHRARAGVLPHHQRRSRRS